MLKFLVMKRESYVVTSVREEYLRRVNDVIESGSSEGICRLLSYMYMKDELSNSQYRSLLHNVVNTTEEFGFYSGCHLYPIEGMDIHGNSEEAYHICSKSKSLWDKNTEYGKARIAIALALAEKL